MTMSRYEVQQFITNATKACLAKARVMYPTYTTPDPTIGFNLKGQGCGGTARGSRELRFNIDWCMHNPVEMLDVVAHEVAHIVASATGLGRNHDYGWKRICLALGGNGKRTGSLTNHAAIPKARRTRQFLYLDTQGREKWIGPTHHSRMQQRGFIEPMMINGRPNYGYSLTFKHDGGKVTKAGYQGRERMAA